MKNKRGISLIVLIITIIVVIILAAIIIITITKNNPVSSAKEATFKQDVRSFQEELSMYIGKQNVIDTQGTREKVTTVDMPSVEVMNEYIKSFSSKYENKLGIYKDELVYYKPDNEVKNKVTDQEEKWLQDLGINKKVVETTEESFEWGSDDPNNSEYYTLKKFIGKETDVIIPKRCHKIGNNAFKNSNITSVKMQDGITYIGDSAFRFCSNLSEVKLSNTLKDMGERAFSSCSSLEYLELPDSLEYLGDFNFYGCSKLKSIKIPDRVKTIPVCAFGSCNSLEEVILPNLNNIFGSAFKYCRSLKNIKLPDSIFYIADEAFSESAIETVNITKNLTNLGNGVFSKCNNLKSITVDQNNSQYTSIDGVLYNKSKTTIVQYPCGKDAESYTIDNNVTDIADRAFFGANKLKTIILGNNVKTIGEYSFLYCSNLTSINIPESVKKINTTCFGFDTSLEHIYLPATIEKMESTVFYACNNLVVDCEYNESDIPSTWSKDWHRSVKSVNYGVKK